MLGLIFSHFLPVEGFFIPMYPDRVKTLFDFGLVLNDFDDGGYFSV